jgi:hypothetical protein
MYPPSISLLLDLQRPGTLRRLYDNPTVISTQPRLRRLRALAGYLAVIARNRRPSPRPAACRDQLLSRA